MTWDSRKEDNEKRRFVEEGLNKRPPVLATAVFFLAMWLSGWACSALLLAQGMHSIPARYTISTVVSYGVFIWSVGIWCRHASRPRKASSGTGWDLGGFDTAGDGEGCLIVIAVLAIALLLSGIFWWVGGYAMLFEVAFEATFAGTMVYRTSKLHTLGNWWETLIRKNLAAGAGHSHHTRRFGSQIAA